MKRGFLEVLKQFSEMVKIWSPESSPVLRDRSPRARLVLLNRTNARKVDQRSLERMEVWDPASGPVLRVLSSHGRVVFRQSREEMVKGVLARSRPWMAQPWRR